MNLPELIYRYPMTYESSEMAYVVEKYLKARYNKDKEIPVPNDFMGLQLLQQSFCEAHDWMLTNKFVVDELGYCNKI